MRKVGAVVLGLLCSVPIMASAATQEEIRAQIEDLLARITALQAQIQTQGTSGTQTETQTPAAPGGQISCPYVSRILKKGSSGADVTRLQQFLALDPNIYPEAQITGYYGPLTEAAVKRFQCKNKIVCEGSPATNGYGVAGPRTAAILALQCPDAVGGQAANVGGFIRVTPTSGAAPLNVAVEANVNTTRSCVAATYEIAFGDASPALNIAVPQNTCQEIKQVFNHTYAAPGIYTVMLRSGVHQTTATVTVSGATQSGGSGGGSFSVTAGVNGNPLTLQTTFGLSSSCSRYDLDWGDGSTHVTQGEGTCASGAISQQLTHTYQNSGSYTITLRRGASLQSTDAAAVTIVN